MDEYVNFELLLLDITFSFWASKEFKISLPISGARKTKQAANDK